MQENGNNSLFKDELLAVGMRSVLCFLDPQQSACTQSNTDVDGYEL
jgi:hypothetical protein